MKCKKEVEPAAVVPPKPSCIVKIVNGYRFEVTDYHITIFERTKDVEDQDYWKQGPYISKSPSFSSLGFSLGSFSSEVYYAVKALLGVE